MSTLFDIDAEVGSSEDEDFDEETGENTKRTNGANGKPRGNDDSSEEEEDDDEEAERAVREGFIVDEDEDDEEERQRRKERRKRRREEREEEEVLDEEDLDLIGELEPVAPTESKFKRLKRGHREDDEVRGVDDIFADEELDEIAPRGPRDAAGEFDDFIEEDEFPDEERDQMLDELEVSRRPKKGFAGISGMPAAGLDEAELEDMRAAFGDGTEYDWALEMQEGAEDDQADPDKPLELKDVFEPSQLAERMLTDEDNIIKATDIPERYQLMRRPFVEPDFTPEELAARTTEEAVWISNMMWPKKRRDQHLLEPFQKSVARILEFINVENYEIPFIFQHRKDYLIHAVQVPAPRLEDPDMPQYEVQAQKLLDQNDLWEILEYDLKFRGLVEKRDSLRKTYESLRERNNVSDEVVDDMLPAAATVEELQDIQDYVHFQYSAEIKDLNTIIAESGATQKRARAATSHFEKMRAGRAYNVVRGFGITADAFARSALGPNRSGYTDDPSDRPDDMADQNVDAEDYPTGAMVLRAAKAMFAEELANSPRMRKLMRQTYYQTGHVGCFRTEKGLRKIDEDHPYYEFKYLRNQSLQAIARRPELYLRMLKAEEEGLVEVQIGLENEDRFKRNLAKTLESDNFSEVADAWNSLRREVLESALAKLQKSMVKGVKENLKTECENALAKNCREEYSRKLDQAPYRPKGVTEPGIEPRVLALTNGSGSLNRNATVWAWVEERGRVPEDGKFTDLRLGNPEKGIPDGEDVAKFVELCERRHPDVIAISGFTIETRLLYKDLQAIVDKFDLQGPEYTDDDDVDRRDKLEVVIVNDEVARLYHTSERSAKDYPGMAPLTRYCVALAKYLQSPLLEYAGLGRDIVSIKFDPDQNLVPQEKLKKQLETAMVDYVNLVGVKVEEAISGTRTTHLLQYVCGLGPRKAAALQQAVNRNGGQVSTRVELLGDIDTGKLQAVGPQVWANCASFLTIEYDATEPTADYLDNTRVHPEDYDLARKMAADALDLDEEDIRAETEDYGASAIVRRLIREKEQERVNDLVLEMYAAQLERTFNSRKRATLETIRAELIQPYEELRRKFNLLGTDEIFTMLTGETKDSLVEGMIVPVAIKRVFPDHLECRLDCGIEGTVPESDFPSGIGMGGTEARVAFQNHQTIQAKISYLNRKSLSAQLSLRDDALRRPYKKELDRMPGEWDDTQENADKRDTIKRKEEVTGRAQRVIKHPLFMACDAKKAEETLGSQSRGDCIIRPSSKGLDHLAITWKVSDGVFQHIDVLELDKENEFSLGRTLKIGGRYTYTDLDELIVTHVKSMARKVEEIMTDERFQTGSKAQTEQWLTAYTEANPRRSMYAFCLNRDFPGYFHLCFKAGQNAPHRAWSVKVVPNAFELQKNAYPSVQTLKNGFKTIYASAGGAGGGGGGAPAAQASGNVPRGPAAQSRGSVPVVVGGGRRY